MIIFALSACTPYGLKPNKDRVVAVVDIVDVTKVPGALGSAQTINGVCHVEIRRDVYPKCFNHEFAHCFSGDWHKGYDTTGS